MGLCTPSLCALAAPWLGSATAPKPRSSCTGCADFSTGLPHLEGLQHHPPTLWHEVPSHGQGWARWDRIPVQEPETGPSTKPQPGFMMGTGSA